MKYTIPYDDKITLPHIKNIDSIGINADNLFYDSKELTGEVMISGDYLLDNSQDVMEFRHDIPVTFLIDDDKISPQINISNFKYELLPGRGLQVMFDLDVILTEQVKEEVVVERENEETKADILEKPKTKNKKNKTRQKTDEDDIKEFQEKIDENLDHVLNNRNKNKEEEEEITVEEEPEEIITKEKLRPETIEVEPEETQEELSETPQTQELEEEYHEEFPDDFILTTNMQSMATSFDTGFVPRDNDKFTTYKILLIENNESLDDLLDTRNLSKALICKEYQFDNKIVLKIENDKL